MNYTLRNNFEVDTLVRPGAVIAPLGAGSFTKFSSARLKAFKTHFVPTRETFGDKFDSLLGTVGIYIAVAATAVAVGTANLTPILHVLHLNGV